MFRQIKLELGQGFNITADINRSDIKVKIFNNQDIVGEASVTTDHIDVSCVTQIYLRDDLVDKQFNDHSLGEILIKFIMKFPSIPRKPEFCFMIEVPENLKRIVAKHHFDEETKPNNEIMIRQQALLPEKRMLVTPVEIKKSITDDELPQLLVFLKKSAYWQAHLTLDRLQMLVKNSTCFFAVSTANEIIGFSRVLTNNTTFASLWDVVVDETERRKGIGMALMSSLFSDPALSTIKNWVLFTDTAKALYQKFGFVSESETPERKVIHKLRLQENHPAYMSDLIHAVPSERITHLNEEATFNFLFGSAGKRANLSSFWTSIPVMTNESAQSFESSYRSTNSNLI